MCGDTVSRNAKNFLEVLILIWQSANSVGHRPTLLTRLTSSFVILASARPVSLAIPLGLKEGWLPRCQNWYPVIHWRRSLSWLPSPAPSIDVPFFSTIALSALFSSRNSTAFIHPFHLP